VCVWKRASYFSGKIVDVEAAADGIVSVVCTWDEGDDER